MKNLNLLNQIIRRGSGASLNLFRYAAMVVVVLLTLGIGQAWADSYYAGFKATGGATGKGYVYASTSNTATPVYETEVTAESQSDDLGSSGATKQYYAWAKAVRGSEFKGWSISGDNGTVTPTSGTDSLITVTVTSAKNKTNTGTATATWTTYTKVNVTYNPSEDGVYSVTYQYNSYNATTKEITTGDAEDLSRTISSENGAQTIDSYENDVITLKSTSGTFQGWYSDAGFNSLLSTANPYTYTAPTSGSAAVHPKYEHVDKYYGRLTASIAAVPYSMPGGGTIFVSKEAAGTGTYSADAQTVDNIGMGTTGLKYYLHAQPTDKRYVFRGWYSNPECTGTALSTNADYTYIFTATSKNSASPTIGNIYAAFDFNLYYMQVEAEPAVPGLGMVLVKDDNSTTPVYTEYTTHSEQFLYAYRLAPTANAYLYAKPKYGYKFSGWYDNPDCTGSVKSTANPYTYTATGSSTDPMNPTITTLYAKFVEDDSKVNITYNIPDKTKGEYTAFVLDIAEVDDEFVWTFTEVYNSADYTANTTLSQNKTEVLQLEAQPKTGYGVTKWYDGADKTSVSHLYSTTATDAKTVGVTFGDAKPFLVCATTSATTGMPYASLREALDNLGSNKKIVVVQNAYVPAGDYIIPSGVTLLVPFDEAQTLYTTKPGITTAAPSGQSAYCTLTLGNGANVKVNGAISVSAHQNKGQPYGGAVTGKYGKIELKEGANITLNSKSFLYCWGYITGAGSVDALDGSTVYEDFQITCWRGGSCANDMVGNDQKVFPLAQYAIQNIEARINFHYGSSETVYTGVTVKYFDPEASAKIIGKTDGLFQLSSGAVLSRWYNASVDRQMYELNGNASIGYVLINMYANIDSRKYVLPITNNMDITVKTGTLSCDNDFALLPGASITIDEGAKASLGSNSRLYVYDKAEWPEKTTGYNYPDNVAFRKVAYTDTKITTARTYANMADAKLDVNGTLEISKAIYTTAGGANICSSEGTGLIVLKAAAGTETVTYQAIQESNYVKEYVAISITSAKLHNADDSYTLTAGAVANDQFIYSKNLGKWLKNPKTITWNANGGDTEASTLAYSEGDFLGELPAAYKDGYTMAGWFTADNGGSQIAATTKVTANATYYAHWTPKSYTITYRDNGGTAFSGMHVDNPNAYPTTHTFGTATALTGATKEHYTFGGWYRTPSCSGAVVTSIAASECKNITLYAKWIINTHELTWNMDGGATSSTAYTAAGDAVAYGTTITYPAASTMTKTNYVFNGWDKSISTMPDEDLTITAQWVPAVASVTVGGNTTYHATVADAIAAAKAKTNPTIKLLQDISMGATTLTYDGVNECTLDLNGHTISGTGTRLLIIDNASATFKVTDLGSKPGKLSLSTSSTSEAPFCVYVNNGNLQLEAGTIYTNSSAKNAGGVRTQGSSTFTMNGGTVHVETGAGLTGYGVQTLGTAIINNGTVLVEAGAIGYALWAQNTGATVTVENGKFNVTGANAYASNAIAPNAALQLKGGYYSTKTMDNSATIDSKYVATNYHVFVLTSGAEYDEGYRYKVAEAYNVTFVDGDGNTIQSGLVEKGQTPAYTGTTPTKSQTAEYTYSFNETWNPAISAVTAAATYTAQFDNTPRSYTLTWNLNGGTVTTAGTAAAVNATGSPSGSVPYSTALTAPVVTKIGYSFNGWNTTVAETMPAAATTYTATWTPIPYTITWRVDGKDDETTQVAYGTNPVYPHGMPSKESEDQYTYTFEGWSNGTTTYGKEETLPAVTGSATYTAQFQDHIRYYTITWINWNGDPLETDGEEQGMQWGAHVSYDGATPVRNSNGAQSFEFKGWWPEIHDVNGDKVYTAQFNMSIDAENADAHTYTVTEDEEVAIITKVAASSVLSVPENKALTTTNLVLEASTESSGNINGIENITVSGNAYFDYEFNVDPWHWSAFGVPFVIDLDAAAPLKEKTDAMVLGTDYDIVYYNTENRAAKGVGKKSWEYVENHEHKLIPGVLYMIAFNRPVGHVGVVRFTKALGAAVDYTVDVPLTTTGAGEDDNWNGIANPKMYHALLDAGVEECQVHDGGPINGDTYDIYTMKSGETDYKFFVGKAAFVQVPYGQSVVEAEPAENQLPILKNNAPRRTSAYGYIDKLDIQIASADGEMEDRIFVRAEEDKADEYVIVADLAKMGVSPSRAQMWVDRYGVKLCKNTTALINNQATYPLGISVPQAGEYTISNANANGDNNVIYLTYDGRIIWNLTYAPYTVSLEKGTNMHYGLKLVHSNAPAVTTDIDQSIITDDQSQIMKVLIDNKVYILRGNNIYSVDGQLVK